MPHWALIGQVPSISKIILFAIAKKGRRKDTLRDALLPDQTRKIYETLLSETGSGVGFSWNPPRDFGLGWTLSSTPVAGSAIGIGFASKGTGAGVLIATGNGYPVSIPGRAEKIATILRFFLPFPLCNRWRPR